MSRQIGRILKSLYGAFIGRSMSMSVLEFRESIGFLPCLRLTVFTRGTAFQPTSEMIHSLVPVTKNLIPNKYSVEIVANIDSPQLASSLLQA